MRDVAALIIVIKLMILKNFTSLDLPLLPFTTPCCATRCLVDPSKEATFKFISTVWGEVGSIFPDPHFMIGGDEVRLVMQLRSNDDYPYSRLINARDSSG